MMFEKMLRTSIDRDKTPEVHKYFDEYDLAKQNSIIENRQSTKSAIRMHRKGNNSHRVRFDLSSDIQYTY